MTVRGPKRSAIRSDFAAIYKFALPAGGFFRTVHFETLQNFFFPQPHTVERVPSIMRQSYAVKPMSSAISVESVTAW